MFWSSYTKISFFDESYKSKEELQELTTSLNLLEIVDVIRKKKHTKQNILKIPVIVRSIS